MFQINLSKRFELCNSVIDEPAGIYLVKVNNRNTRTRCEICLKLTIKIPKRRQWRRSDVFIVKFIVKYFTPCSNVSIVDFELATADRVRVLFTFFIILFYSL